MNRAVSAYLSKTCVLLNISVFYAIDSANRKLPSDMMFMVLNDRKIHPDAFQINIILFHEMSTF